MDRIWERKLFPKRNTSIQNKQIKLDIPDDAIPNIFTRHNRKLNLHEAIEEYNFEQFQINLISDNLEKKSDNGKTPLFHAIKRNFVKVVELLLERGADMFSADSANQTPLHAAINNNAPESLEVLLQRNPNGHEALKY